MRYATYSYRLLFLGSLLLMTFAGTSFAVLSGPSPIPNPPNFNITVPPTVLCRGQTNYLKLNVTNGGTSYPSIGISNLNGGTTMQDVQINVVSSKSVIPAGNGTAYIGSIKPFNSVTTTLPVFVNQSGPIVDTVEVAINYYYLFYYSDSETRNFTFETAQCQSPISVNMTPKTLVSGEIQNVSIALRNTGTTAINALNVRYSVPPIDGAIVGSQQANIALLAPGETAKLNATIFVSRNASIESFPVNITTTFYSNGNLEQILNSTSIVPAGAIDMQPSGLVLSPASTQPGGIFSVSFVLTDIGTSGASATSAYALLPNGFSAYGSNPVYIGDIAADTQSPVTLTLLTAADMKSGTYTVPIRINYLNALRQNETEIMNVSVNVSASNFTLIKGAGATAAANGVYVRGGQGSGILLLLVIVLIIALASVSWLYYRERKRNRRHQGAK